MNKPHIYSLLVEAKMQRTGWRESMEGHFIGSFGQRCCPHLISFLAVVTGKVGSSQWQHSCRGNRIALLAQAQALRSQASCAASVTGKMRVYMGSGAAGSGTRRRENSDSLCSSPGVQSTRRWALNLYGRKIHCSLHFWGVLSQLLPGNSARVKAAHCCANWTVTWLSRSAAEVFVLQEAVSSIISVTYMQMKSFTSSHHCSDQNKFFTFVCPICLMWECWPNKRFNGIAASNGQLKMNSFTLGQCFLTWEGTTFFMLSKSQLKCPSCICAVFYT